MGAAFEDVMSRNRKDAEQRQTWRQAMAAERPLLLPVAHDALSARLIARAGFRAYSVGGFPMVGARHALPDLGLVSFGEMAAGMRDILAASELPVLLDADDGYGDVKSVTRTVRSYESMGASALFIEDQVSPKRCGHMAGKKIVPAQVMVAKIRAAAAARRDPETFLIARTDARATEGLDGALRRAERYLNAGADGLFVEAPQSAAELARVAQAFDVPQLANMLEDGVTPILPPAALGDMGFAMVAYPVSLVFRVVHTIDKALADLRAGTLTLAGEGVGFDAFKEVVGFDDWAAIEARAESEPRPE